MSAKQLAKDFFKIFGVRVTRLTRNDFFDSENGYAGVRALMKGKEENSVFFDVGANTGQTVSTLRHYFPMGTIHPHRDDRSVRTRQSAHKLDEPAADLR